MTELTAEDCRRLIGEVLTNADFVACARAVPPHCGAARYPVPAGTMSDGRASPDQADTGVDARKCPLPVGEVNAGYTIIHARIKNPGIPGGCYGVALGHNADSGGFVTWQFHIDEGTGGDVDYHWGHYFEGPVAAIRDYKNR